MKFVDTAKIYIKAGDGGAGHISFRREKFVPKGGPDGGNGGKGGDVVFYTDPHMNTLLDFKYKRHYKAQNGAPGGKNRCTGKDGESVVIKVPCGTSIIDDESGKILADLTEPNKNFILLYGGKGGRGNCEFATPVNQAPRYAEPGIEGKELNVTLELKTIADSGIVGFPNAGKSTFISVVSAAKPKIADYPFTTLTPNLGIVYISEGKSYAVADIPGIIEGASEGKGLGFQFLKHIERTKVLLFLLDPNSEIDVKTQYKTLNNEIKKYNAELLSKKRLVCISKADCLDETQLNELRKVKLTKQKEKIYIISSVANLGIEELKMDLWKSLNPEVV